MAVPSRVHSTPGGGRGGWWGATDRGGPASWPGPHLELRPSIRSRDVWIWHDSDEPITAGHVRSWG